MKSDDKIGTASPIVSKATTFDSEVGFSQLEQTTTTSSISKLSIKHRFDIDKILKLVNLTITNEEKEIYSGQIDKILDYMNKLGSVNTDNIEPTFNVSGSFNNFRTDETSASLSQQEALQNAPKKERGFFVTKGVFDK